MSLATGFVAHPHVHPPQCPDLWPEAPGLMASNAGKLQRPLEHTELPPARQRHPAGESRPLPQHRTRACSKFSLARGWRRKCWDFGHGMVMWLSSWMNVDGRGAGG